MMRDSIIASLNTQELSMEQDADSLLIGAIKTGNLKIYCNYTVNYGLLKRELYPYNLYIFKKYDLTPAYDDIFSYFHKPKTQGSKPNIDIHWMNSMKTNAIWPCMHCLNLIRNDIPKMPEYYYFREGIYFLKDIDTANKLDSIYQHRPLVLC